MLLLHTTSPGILHGLGVISKHQVLSTIGSDPKTKKMKPLKKLYILGFIFIDLGAYKFIRYKKCFSKSFEANKLLDKKENLLVSFSIVCFHF